MLQEALGAERANRYMGRTCGHMYIRSYEHTHGTDGQDSYLGVLPSSLANNEFVYH